LFSELVDDETDDSRRRDLVLFLKEFCTFSQALQVQSRDTFFKVSGSRFKGTSVMSLKDLLIGCLFEVVSTFA